MVKLNELTGPNLTNMNYSVLGLRVLGLNASYPESLVVGRREGGGEVRGWSWGLAYSS